MPYHDDRDLGGMKSTQALLDKLRRVNHVAVQKQRDLHLGFLDPEVAGHGGTKTEVILPDDVDVGLRKDRSRLVEMGSSATEPPDQPRQCQGDFDDEQPSRPAPLAPSSSRTRLERIPADT